MPAAGMAGVTRMEGGMGDISRTTFSLRAARSMAAVALGAWTALQAASCAPEGSLDASGTGADRLGVRAVPPPPVTGFVAEAGEARVELTWVNPAGATLDGVRIQRGLVNHPAKPDEGATVYEGMDTEFSDTELSNGTIYHYAAFAFDRGRRYSAGVQASALPADQTPPGNVAASSAMLGNGHVTLHWRNPDDDDFAGLVIQRGVIDFPVLPTEGTRVYEGMAASFTDLDLTNGTTYLYSAFSYDDSQNFASGTQFIATPADREPPADVGGFVAVAGDGEVHLSWFNPNDWDLEGVVIRRSIEGVPDNDIAGVGIFDGYADTFADRGLINGVRYFYAAFAYDADQNYSLGVEAAATPRTRFVDLSAGADHTCGLAAGKVLCWGYDGSGESTPPELIEPLEASAGGSHVCALEERGVVCWGRNDVGQSSPPFLDYPAAVAAGENHTCALDDSGVVCWGDDEAKQSSPPSLHYAYRIAAGARHTCAVDGARVVCWGDNNEGQTAVPALDDPKHVTAGEVHTCALDAARVVCWGGNERDQLEVPPLEHPTAISAGGRHTCALDDFGVTCWGDNRAGQSDPPPLLNPTRISAGGRHSCALTDEGIICWGDDNEGQATPAM